MVEAAGCGWFSFFFFEMLVYSRTCVMVETCRRPLPRFGTKQPSARVERKRCGVRKLPAPIEGAPDLMKLLVP